MIVFSRRWAAIITLASGLACGSAGVAGAQDQPNEFSPAEAEAIRSLVRDYLVEHPEVLVEALQVYQERQRAEAAERQRAAVVAQNELLLNDADSPVIGNPEGDVVLVEFFDYRCGYCKSVAQQLRQTVAEDGNIRLVMKEFPILSSESRFAARAALAAAKQEKYEEFHFALMEVNGALNTNSIFKLAAESGLDVDKLKFDMQQPDIDAALRRTYDLAKALQISGTPAFVLGDKVIPGAVDMTTLKTLIAELRADAS